GVIFTSTDTALAAEPLSATTRSGLLSPLKSLMATNTGVAPVAKSCLAVKDKAAAAGPLVLSSTDTVSSAALATARSAAPSAFKSPTATAVGLVPVAKSCLAAKTGAPAP